MVLNSFLHFLEEAEPTSLIVAATNHPDLLDPALFRRFDDVLEYSLPTSELTRHAFEARLQALHTKGVDWAAVVAAAEGLSYAEIAKACQDAVKEAVLADRREIGTDLLLRALQERRTFQGRPTAGGLSARKHA